MAMGMGLNMGMGKGIGIGLMAKATGLFAPAKKDIVSCQQQHRSGVHNSISIHLPWDHLSQHAILIRGKSIYLNPRRMWFSDH